MLHMSRNERFSRREFLSLSLASAGAVGVSTLIKPKDALATEDTKGTTVFIDDLGRSVRVSNAINSVTPTGINAQTMLCELCPEKIASLAVEISKADATDYEDVDMGELAQLPETGTLFSTSDTDIDSDEVVEISPAVMIDVGLPQKGLADKLNALQLETNIPYIFIDISFGNLPKAYRTLGLLLGCIQRAEDLASYVETVMSEVKEIANSQGVSRRVFYAQRELGLAVTEGISLQLDALAYIGAIPVTEPYDFVTKQICFDTLAESEIDWILFDDTDVLESLQQGKGRACDIWSNAMLLCGAGFMVSPALYHSWLGSMVFVQSIGLLWLTCAMWPASCGYGIEQRAQEFYTLFYDNGLVKEKAPELVGDLPKSVPSDTSDQDPVRNHTEEAVSDEW
jgi:ABC-type Fe3+-hydroxamate transport system substrate-binding protein